MNFSGLTVCLDSSISCMSLSFSMYVSVFCCLFLDQFHFVAKLTLKTHNLPGLLSVPLCRAGAFIYVLKENVLTLLSDSGDDLK